ncbi:hypothetical protein [Bacillus massilinigeriensis]|uniref:hypothetical protein n=1 Tax=Bacillus mediterraneensis TaxID=1805474 RepID=UPI0008F94E38|nr:hypothetical protein [Bacillus mediterraneensis]
MEKVTAMYVFEGKSFDSENEKGVLVGDKVLVSDNDGTRLYECQQTKDPSKVVVNLDVNDTNYLNGRPDMLLDLIKEGPKNMKRVTVYRKYDGEIDWEFAELGVLYEDRGIVLQCDNNGLIAFFEAKPLDGHENAVIVEEGAEDLSQDNPGFVIDLIMGGAGR